MPVGGKTEPIVAAITVSEKVKTSFNVVVVQECAPVTYDENGNPCVAPDAKWDATAQYDKRGGRRVMKRKLPIILVASSAIMLAASTIGSTKATLTYMSDNYLAQIDIKSIGVL